MSEEKEATIKHVAEMLCSGTPYMMRSRLVESVIEGLAKMALVELKQIELLLELKS